MRWLGLLIGLMALTTTAAARGDDAVRLASLDWPPFSSRTLPGEGAVAAVVRAAFAASGVVQRTEFFPWARAVERGIKAPGLVGYFPEYHSTALETTCQFSRSLGESPLGLAERRSTPIAWKHVDDLRPIRLGVVQSYVNTEALDRAIQSGLQPAETAIDDLTNLRKLAAGRIDAAVIDVNVMAFLLSRAPAVADLRAMLQFNARTLEIKTLHVCFRRDAAGAAALRQLEAGLDMIDVPSIFRDAIAQSTASTRS